MNCTVIYFSPTGNSKKSTLSVAAALSDKPCREIDITPAANAGITESFGSEDFVVFGLPVYGGRLPAVAVPRLNHFKGAGTPCIILVTYGNRDYDDALLELSDLVRTNGFLPLGAAALVGKHTYGEIQTDRPNASDLAENRQFARSVLHAPTPSSSPLQIKGNRPYKAGPQKSSGFIPHTTEACINCTLCVEQCPTSAIGDDCKTIAPENCISCFGCISCCPVQAKVMDSPEYLAFAAEFSKKLATPRPNEYFLNK